jgi:hypothetical protein
MRMSSRFIEYVKSNFSASDSTRLLQSIETLDEEHFGGQDPERLSLAMAILVGRGIELDAVIGLARRDWRDLLVAAGLGHETWRDVLSGYLESHD